MSDTTLGIVLGSLVGITLVLVALLEQYPKWKEQGFLKAKTPEEYQIVKNYYSGSYKRRVKFYYKKYAIPLIGMTIVLAGVVISRGLIFSASLSFLITFLGGFLLSALIVDSIIRKQQNSR